MKLRRSSTEKYAAQKMQEGGTQEEGTNVSSSFTRLQRIFIRGLDPKEAFVCLKRISIKYRLPHSPVKAYIIK